MPELPEVESIARRLAPDLLGKRITRFVCLWARQAQPDPETLARRLTGRRIARVWRRGKYLLCTLDDESSLLIHLRMSGRLLFLPGESPQEPGPHTRAFWVFADGSRLFFDDARKFGRLAWLPDLAPLEARLGPEPLAEGFSAARLGDCLGHGGGGLKAALLNQARLAGMGNIYSDEALYRARLHPRRRVGSLTKGELRRLHEAIRTVLELGLLHNGTSIDWIYPEGRMQDHLLVYGRKGEPCLGCGRPLSHATVAGRGSTFCPHCQKES